MSPLSITPPTKTSAPPAPKSASPPSGAAGDFAALLDQTSARTAPAEGPKKRPAQPESSRRNAAALKDDNKAAVAPDAQAHAVAEQAQPQAAADGKPLEGAHGQSQPAAGDPAATPADPAAAGATLAAEQSAAAAVVRTAAPATGATAPIAGTATGAVGTATPVAVVTAPSVATQAAVGAATAQPGSANAAPAGDAGAPADGETAGKLQIPTELLNAKGGQAKDFQHGDQSQRDLPPAPTLPPTADAAAAPTPAASAAASNPVPVADPGAAPAPTPTATTQAQPAAAPPAAAMPVANGAPQLSRTSVLQTAERVQELVRIATTRAGTARAVLQLRPAELGQVDVHLRTTRNGLVATIAAHEQVGHDALQQAGNELRRTLEDKGVHLHSLDLQLGAGDNGFTNQGDAREANSGRRGAGASHDLAGDAPVAEDELTITHAPSTPAGVLVDVQA
jgi:flagellar hook-length control protein FliK